MDYAFQHEGKVFIPDGRAHSLENTLDLTGTAAVDAHNREQEQAEIAMLKTHPDRAFLYVKEKLLSPSSWDMAQNSERIAVTTWLGTAVSDHCWIGPRRAMGFGFHSYRRAISARIFGVTYHGWYFESTGNYCRLRKAKRQPKTA